MSSPQPTQLKRYDTDIDLGVDNAHTRVMRLVGREKRVLELGCATGYMSRVLTKVFGCVVTGVELNPAAAEEARSRCARVIVGDLDTIDWDEVLGVEEFDVVVAADVLEHLRNPARALAAVRPHLSDGGYVVASIPNVAHTSVVAELLHGRFTYRPFGLLDDTHVRFFTRDTIYECFEESGFTVTYLDRMTLEPGDTEFQTVLSILPSAVVSWLESREEATSYQFILTAHPAKSAADSPERAVWPRTDNVPQAEYEPVLKHLVGEPDRNVGEGVLHAIAGRLAYLENTRSQQTETISVLRAALARHEIYVATVTAESEARRQELTRAKAYVDSLLGEIESLKGELKAASERASDLQRALEAQAKRLLQERLRMADALESAQDPLLRQIEQERSRLARQLEEESARAANRVNELEQHVVVLRASVETYERSRSWRLTAPLRAFGRLLRGR